MATLNPLHYGYMPENALDGTVLLADDIDAYDALRRENLRFGLFDKKLIRPEGEAVPILALCIFDHGFLPRTPYRMRLESRDNFLLQKELYDTLDGLGFGESEVFWLRDKKTEVAIVAGVPEKHANDLTVTFAERLSASVSYAVTVAASEVFYNIRILYTAIRYAWLYADFARFVESDSLYMDKETRKQEYQKLLRRFPDYHRANYERIILSAVLNNNFTHAELITTYFAISNLMDYIPHYANLRVHVSNLMRMVIGLATPDPRDLVDGDARIFTCINRLAACPTFTELQAIMRDFYAIIAEYIREAPGEADDKRKMQRVVEYIEENYANPMISAQSVCDEFSISPSYLSRAFKEKMGVNLSIYIQVLRVEQAKRLMLSTGLTTDAIAEQIGYSNGQTLLKVFKKIEGITPSAYKKMALRGVTIGKNDES